MDYAKLIDSFGALGPPLGAVLAIGVIAIFLIKLISKLIEMLKELTKKIFHMFDQHAQAMSDIRQTTEAHTIIIRKVADNVEENTKATHKMTAIITKSSKKK